MTLTVLLTADISRFEAAITEFGDLLASAPEGVTQKLVGLCDVPDQLCRIDNDTAPAAGTCELVVRLQPSDLLLDLLQAMRAGDFDAHVINGCADHVLHGSTSDGCVSSSIEDRPPAESQDPPGGQPTPNPARPISSQ